MIHERIRLFLVMETQKKIPRRIRKYINEKKSIFLFMLVPSFLHLIYTTDIITHNLIFL